MIDNSACMIDNRRRLTILRFCEIFVFTLYTVALKCFCGSLLQICMASISVTKRLVSSTLNGLFTCTFDVGRVKIFCFSVSECLRSASRDYSTNCLSDISHISLLSIH